MAKKTPVLVAKDISLNYEIKALRNNKTRWTKITSAIIGHKKTIEALKQISLNLNAGEIISVVGNAGSGKSSLLETLSGSVKPTTGEVWAIENPVLLNGSFGFFGQLSGSENIQLALLSMGTDKNEAITISRSLIENLKLKKIAHNPINSYSTTTKKRMMLEVALSHSPRILFIDQRIKLRGTDERKEFEEKIRGLAKSGSCIVFVGLPPRHLPDICNRVIWLENGQIKDDGTVKRVLPLFRSRKK
jgi:teichoic acid transport system ATP-binding protein